MSDKFEKFIRDYRPDVPENLVDKKVQWAMLREKIRQKRIQTKRQRLKRSIGAVALIGVMFVSGNLSQLGSDGFDIQELDTNGQYGQVYQHVFRKDKFNVPKGTPESTVEAFVQEMALDTGVVRSVEGIRIGDCTWWMITREYVVNGESTFTSERSDDPLSCRSRQVGRFWIENSAALLPMVESGEIQVSGETEITLEGYSFKVKVWSLEPLKRIPKTKPSL